MEEIKWKLKEDATPQGSSDGFWYDLTDGGYIRPDELIDDKDQLKKVLEAIQMLRSLEEALNDAELIEEF